VSDEPQPTVHDTAAAEPLPRGVSLLAEAALRSPAPSPEAEAVAQERAVSAYQASLLDPRPLHPEPWRPGSGLSLVSRLAAALRRLRGQ
jgi:hypothetical protein